MKLVLGLMLFLAACTTLEPVTFDQPVAVNSELRAAVALVSGPVRGTRGTSMVPAGTILVPLSIGPWPQLQFHVDDQRAFVDSFRRELERLKLVAEARDVASVSSAELGIQIIFAQTQHNQESNTYVLDVVMEIVGGKTPFLKQYRVVSSEGDSTWKKFNTNAAEGKAKAAHKLIRLLIPDVAAYLEQNRTPHRSPIGPTPFDRAT